MLSDMRYTAARLVRYARRQAGLSQHALAEKAGMLQSVIARIETGKVSPRFETVLKLLRACGSDLEIQPLAGQGIDRTLIREVLRLNAMERVEAAAAAAINLARLEASVRK